MPPSAQRVRLGAYSLIAIALFTAQSCASPSERARGSDGPATVHAGLSMPRSATGIVTLSEGSRRVAFSLEGATDARIEPHSDGHIARGAAPGGGDIVYRDRQGGVEDWVTIPTHANTPVALRYRVDVSAFAGLRLVGGVLEMLDADGTPRFRVGPASVVDARGARRRARLDVEGCVADRAATPPWGRSVTKPGASSCAVSVRWDDADLVYPLVVDPPWTATSALAVTRWNHTATLVAGGKVMVAGGSGDTTAELYDPTTRTWAMTGSLSAARTSHTAATLVSGQVLIAGGYVGATAVASAEVYDPATGMFTATGGMTAPRGDFAASVLTTGSVLVEGGFIDSSNDTRTPTAEVYDPSTGKFTATASMANARAFHSATALVDGRVLVVGTWGDTPEIYSAGTWSGIAGPSPIHHTATLLADGRVMVVGGLAGGGLSNTAQTTIFDPGTGMWTAAAPLPGPFAPRFDHAATILSDGGLFVVGGQCDNACAPANNFHEYNDGVLWQSSNDTWAATSAPMSQVRIQPSATLLPSGNVLVTGGEASATSEELCLAEGCPCNVASECLTGHCADGVCCDSDCVGTCSACTATLKGQGTDGTCGPILVGTDPQSECTAALASSCGLDGMCDGAGACQMFAAGTVCAPSSCIDAMSENHADTCDGVGTCVDNASGPCDTGYVCESGGCVMSCTVGTDCATGYECIAGACKKRPNGTACDTEGQCASTHCVDGVCCDSTCEGQCEACGEPSSPGICKPVDAPRAPRPACVVGDKTCESVCDGKNPTACTFPGKDTTCGVGHTCDGKGACVQPTALCSPDRSSSIASSGTTTACSPYLCDTSTGECASSCTAAADCIASAFCNDKQCETASPTAESSGGCSVGPRAPGRTGIFGWIALAGAVAWWRRKRVRTALVVGMTAALGGCSQADPARSADPHELPTSADATQSVEALGRSFQVDGHSAIPMGEAKSFVVEGGRVMARDVGFVNERGRVELPMTGDGATRIADDESHIAATLMLEGAVDTPVETANGIALYRHAAPGGGDILQRVDATGVEHYVTIARRGDATELRYRLALEGAAGLRLIENNLELVDKAGAPRLRVLPPWIVDSLGERHAARLAVTGCAVDVSPVAPFGRPVTPPGAPLCTLIVSWGNDVVDYPILVDPSMTWTQIAGPGYFMGQATAVLADGKLLVVGGEIGVNTVEIYSAGVFAVGTNMLVPRTGATATLLASGQVLVAGGNTATAELYDPGTGMWTAAASMSVSRQGHRAVHLADDSVLVTAGDGVGTTERYIPGSGWVIPAGNLGSARTAHTATLLPDGRVLVVGGTGALPANTTSLFSIANGWVAGPSLVDVRQYHSAALLSTGKVLVAGGWISPNFFQTAELFDPVANTWSPAAPMLQASAFAASVTFGAGSKVYVIGGLQGGTTHTSIYDVATNTWSDGVQLQRIRTRATADLVPTGEILVVGGDVSSKMPSPCELLCVDFGCACSAALTCLVGTCVDSVCCSTACSGLCEACSAAVKGSGVDGVCGPVADDSDPGDDCATDPASSCGSIGTCDGTGACRLYAAGTTCAAASCTSTTIETPVSTCDGAGKCAPAATASCMPGYTCMGTTCLTSCTQTSDCDVGFICKNSACVKKANGEPCTGASECTSGLCADDVCCNTVCDGECENCASAGTPGLCVQTKGPPVGKKTACAGADAGTCGGVCSDNTKACTYPTASCGDGKVCANGECVQAQPICIDTGTSQSPAGVKTPCTPYLCDSTKGTCLTSCTVAAECGAAFVCVNQQCVDLGGGSGGGTVAAGSPDATGGCGCRVAPSSGKSGWLVALALGAVAFGARRRRHGVSRIKPKARTSRDGFANEGQ